MNLTHVFHQRSCVSQAHRILLSNKSHLSLGSVLPGIGALAASYVGCNATLVTLCFTLGMAFMGFVYASSCVNPIDLSPNFSATIMALNNGLGCVSGTLAPLSVGFLTENVSDKIVPKLYLLYLPRENYFWMVHT